MLTKEEINEKLEKCVSNWGMALNIYLQQKMKYTEGDESCIVVATNPVTSLIVSALISFILGCFLNTYSVNHILTWADTSQHIHWFLGGVLGVFPKIGRYTIPVFILVFLIKNFLL